jgi:transglutaminase-like putative cysteine protease
MAQTIDLKQFVPMPAGNFIVHFEDGDTDDIITVLERGNKRAAKERPLKELASLLRGANDYETCKKVFDTVMNNFEYVADKKGLEVIKSPATMLYYRRGDCKSYSLAAGTFLRELSIPFSYRFISQEVSDPTPTHVYVVAHTTEGDVYMDAVLGRFNREPNYFHYEDLFDPFSKPQKGIKGLGDTKRIDFL